jgi:deoxyribose-phosphate aldolase
MESKFMQSDIALERKISKPSDLAWFIDHTLLKAEATSGHIHRLCQEAMQFKFRAVCVNSAFVKFAVEQLQNSGVNVAATVGFPLGAQLTSIKAAEAERCVVLGAREIDMVLAIGSLKEGDLLHVEQDIATVVKASGYAVVKVILETALLNNDEITTACKLAEAGGAIFVKTSTGFNGRGASIEDIHLMKAAILPHMQIKASGGIKTFEQAKALIEAGASRLGTSSGVALVSGLNATSTY